MTLIRSILLLPMKPSNALWEKCTGWIRQRGSNFTFNFGNRPSQRVYPLWDGGSAASINTGFLIPDCRLPIYRTGGLPHRNNHSGIPVWDPSLSCPDLLQLQSHWTGSAARLPQLVNKLAIRKAQPCLEDQGTKNHSAWLRHVPCIWGKHGNIQCSPGSPWQLLCNADPFVIHVELHAAGHVEINETQLFILAIGRFVHGFSPQSASCQAHGYVKTTNLACTLLCKIQAKMHMLSAFTELLTRHYL